MGEDTTVTIGAKIDGVLAAIGQVSQQLTGMAAAADKVHQSFTSLAKTTAGALGLGLSIAAMTSFTRSMADAGLHSEQLKAQLGVTGEGLGELKGIAKLTGIDMDTMATGISRLSLNVQSATKDGFSPQAQALRVLGLSTKELIGLNGPEYFAKFADTVSRFNPSMNLTNALVAIGGRSMLQMLPALLLGREYLEKWGAQLKEVRYGLEGFAPKASDTHARLVLLDAAVDGASKRIFLALKPAIDVIIGALTSFFKSLDVQTIQKFAKAMTDWLAVAVIYLIELFDLLGNKIDTVLSRIQRVLLGGAIGGALGLLGGGAGAIGGAVLGAGIVTAWDTFMSSFTTKEKEAEGTVSQGGQAMIDKVKAFVEQIKTAMAGAFNAPSEKTDGANAGALNLGAKTAIEATIARINGEIAILRGGLAQKQVIFQLEADMWALTEQQKLKLTLDASKATFAAEEGKLKAIRDLWPAHTKEWEEANRKMLQASQGFKTNLMQINADIIRDFKSKLDDVGNALMSSFNSQLRGLLAGTTTWRAALKSIFGDMVIYAIQAIEKMVMNWATGQLAMVIATATGEAGKTEAVAAGTVARSAIELPAVLASIGKSVSKLFAELSAWLTPLEGPAAPANAAAVAAGVSATAIGAIAGWEQGTNYVPRTGLALLHEGEQVIPASEQGPPFSGGGGITINAWDGASVQSWLARGGATMLAKAMKGVAGNNLSLRPA